MPVLCECLRNFAIQPWAACQHPALGCCPVAGVTLEIVTVSGEHKLLMSFPSGLWDPQE